MSEETGRDSRDISNVVVGILCLVHMAIVAISCVERQCGQPELSEVQTLPEYHTMKR